MMNKIMHAIETIVRGVCVKDGHLLVYQNTNFGYICLPGGHVEFWEPMTEALRREWNEEVGCDCGVGKFLNFFEDCFDGSDGKRRHHITFLYEVFCDALNVHKPLKQQESHIALQWISLSEIRSCNFVSTAQQAFLCTYLKL
jgi:ADP-ribose pyrophosphatase YjhB (NUDIX family)